LAFGSDVATTFEEKVGSHQADEIVLRIG